MSVASWTVLLRLAQTRHACLNNSQLNQTSDCLSLTAPDKAPFQLCNVATRISFQLLNQLMKCQRHLKCTHEHGLESNKTQRQVQGLHNHQTLQQLLSLSTGIMATHLRLGLCCGYSNPNSSARFSSLRSSLHSGADSSLLNQRGIQQAQGSKRSLEIHACSASAEYCPVLFRVSQRDQVLPSVSKTAQLGSKGPHQAFPGRPGGRPVLRYMDLKSHKSKNSSLYSSLQFRCIQ
jgi:hypothetical protein